MAPLVLIPVKFIEIDEDNTGEIGKCLLLMDMHLW